jgi:hypothetical protein
VGRQQTVLDFTRGDTSGIQAIRNELAAAAEDAQKLQKILGETGGAPLTPEQRMEAERLKNERVALQTQQVEARRALLQDSEGARGKHKEEREQEREQARQEGHRLRRIQGMGQLGAGVISTAASGSPGGLLSGIGAMTSNPWALAGLAAGGAFLYAAKSGLSEAQQAAVGYTTATMEAAPYLMRQGPKTPDRSIGVRYGYGPAAAMRAYGLYGRSSGLEDAGLDLESILQLDRSRGIGADVAGGVSSIFAAGRGGAGGGSPEELRQFFRAAVGEGLEQGLKNAHLPEYLQKVAETTTRYADLGFNVDPRDILGVQAGLRGIDREGFAGSRGISMIGRFQQSGMGLADQMASILPKEMLDQVVMARYLRRTGGDLGAAIELMETESANGDVMQEYARGARRMYGGGKLGAVALRHITGSMRHARGAYKYDGPGKVAEAELYDGTDVLGLTTKSLSRRAALENKDIGLGIDTWGEAMDIDEATKSVKHAATEAAVGVWRGAKKAFRAGTDTTDRLWKTIWQGEEPTPTLRPVPKSPSIPMPKMREATDEEKRTIKAPPKGHDSSAVDPGRVLFEAAVLLAQAAADFRRGNQNLEIG